VRAPALLQWEWMIVTTASPITILGIDHVVLRVRDMTRMRQFYCDVLACRLEKIQDAIGLVQLRAGRSLIDLVDVAGKLGQLGGAPPGREARNMDHLCLRVEPFDADKISAHLRAHGVTPGEVVSRYGAEGEGPSMYIADPEGNSIELKGPPGV
jgi:glyoxylase I family protein